MAEQRRSYPSKITTSTIGLKTEKLEQYARENRELGSVAVMRVYGRIRETESVNTTYGTSTRFKGEFEAINLTDNSVHRSQNLFVPGIAEQVVLDVYNTCKKRDPESMVKFGLDITVDYKPNAGNQKGTEFRFGVSPLIEASGDDVLSQIGRELGAPPAIEAPKAAKGKKK